MSRLFRSERQAITLIELVVAVAIAGVLLGLTLSGVHAAREAARNAACQNNLRQVGLAMTNHTVATQHLPTGGWGVQWMGVAELGHGKRQPGGWAYNLLPFVEAAETFQLVGSITQAKSDIAAVRALALAKPTVLACPSRPARTVDVNPDVAFFSIHSLEIAASSDYAVNAGSVFQMAPPGPDSFESASSYLYPGNAILNGVSLHRSELRPSEVIDGLSNTCYAGERWISRIEDIEERDQPIFSGDCLDIRRFTQEGPRPDWIEKFSSRLSFGSAHPSGINTAFCDGSTRFASYRIDEQVFANMGNRKDGTTLAP